MLACCIFFSSSNVLCFLSAVIHSKLTYTIELSDFTPYFRQCLHVPRYCIGLKALEFPSPFVYAIYDGFFSQAPL